MKNNKFIKRAAVCLFAVAAIAAGFWYVFFVLELDSFSDKRSNESFDAEKSGLVDTGEATLTSGGVDGSALPTPTEAVFYVVFVCGEVVTPDVYSLPAGSLVRDAVAAAGGFSDKADREYLNLAREVSDHERVYVPSLEETAVQTAYWNGGGATGGNGSGSGSGGSSGNGAGGNSGSGTGGSSGNVAGSGSATSGRRTEESDKSMAGSGNGSNSGINGNGLVNINTATAEELITLPGIGEARARDIISYRTNIGPFEKIEDIKNVSGIGDKMFTKLMGLITVE